MSTVPETNVLGDLASATKLLVASSYSQESFDRTITTINNLAILHGGKENRLLATLPALTSIGAEHAAQNVGHREDQVSLSHRTGGLTILEHQALTGIDAQAQRDQNDVPDAKTVELSNAYTVTRFVSQTQKQSDAPHEGYQVSQSEFEHRHALTDIGIQLRSDTLLDHSAPQKSFCEQEHPLVYRSSPCRSWHQQHHPTPGCGFLRQPCRLLQSWLQDGTSQLCTLCCDTQPTWYPYELVLVSS